MHGVTTHHRTKEYAMKTLATLIGTFAPVTAFAASAAHEDNSGLFVWGFLGMCALIIVAQVLPALMLLFGMVKSVTTKTEAKEVVNS
jgi:uncharacterized membrane protein (GlpM family)